MNNFETIYVDGVPTEKEYQIEYGCLSPIGFLVSNPNPEQSYEVTLHFAEKEPEKLIADTKNNSRRAVKKGAKRSNKV
jgi:hypothetical protein